MHEDGTFVGRSAPEIDVFEAQVCSHAAIDAVIVLTNYADIRHPIDRPSFSVLPVGSESTRCPI